MLNISQRERGQVMILLTVGIIALLGFAALAIDSGMYYVDRRYDQNAADAAALAAAGAAGNYLETNGILQPDFDCEDEAVLEAISLAEQAAIQNAAVNLFTIDTDINDGHGVEIICVDDGGGENSKYLDARVKITSQTRSTFIHLVFSGPLQNTVEAISRVHPGNKLPFADGLALVALNTSCPANPNCGVGQNQGGGITSCGGTNVTITTGGAWSNACLAMNGSGNIYANAGSYYLTTYVKSGNSGSFLPEPQKGDAVMTLEVDPPNCGALGAGYTETHHEGSPPNRINYLETWPGNYSGLRIQGNLNEIRMHPGLYCLSGDFSANNGKISIIGTASEGVTLYFTDGDFDLAGSVTVNLRAPTEGSTGTPPAIPGMLIFFAEGHDGGIFLRGTSDSSYEGTVFAPDGSVDLGGNSSTIGGFFTQVIADTVRIFGDPGLVVNFTEGQIYNVELPAVMDMHK